MMFSLLLSAQAKAGHEGADMAVQRLDDFPGVECENMAAVPVWPAPYVRLGKK